MATGGARQKLVTALWAGVLALLLLLPGMINGDPLLFPDSMGYFHAGEAAAGEAQKLISPKDAGGTSTAPAKTLEERQSDNISTARSAYYGLFFWLMHRIGGEWGLPLAQIAITVLSLQLALPHLFAPGARRSALAQCSVALIALVGGLGAFAITIMPDIFSGLMILGLAILLIRWRRLSVGEKLYWLALVFASCLFHKASVALGIMLVALFAFAAIVVRRFPLWNVAALTGVLMAAFAAHAAVGIAVERLTGRPTVEVPFLLARIVGDGTAERYLRRRCPDAGFALCGHLHRFPMSENDFLWSPLPEHGLMNVVAPEESALISREAPAVVIETVQAYPLAQLAASSENAVRQFFGVGVTEFGRPIKTRTGLAAEMQALLRNQQDSAVAEGWMPLPAISRVMTAAYVAALLALMLLAPRLVRRGADERLMVALLLCAGVTLNAIVTGVLSGVFDRYQGRVAWLLLLAAAIAFFSLRERSAGAPPQV